MDGEGACIVGSVHDDDAGGEGTNWAMDICSYVTVYTHGILGYI